MSGVGGSEFILLCLIGLLILGPERLPRVARQLGSWVGKARQMTRSLQRQLEDELDVEKNLGFNPDELKNINPRQMMEPLADKADSPTDDDDDDDDDVVAPTPGKSEEKTA
jgi:sec-independent protein translocase protein TatB